MLSAMLGRALPLALLGFTAIGCQPAIPVTGYASATCVPRPVLFGPVEKVGGGAVRATASHKLDMIPPQLAKRSHESSTYSVGSTTYSSTNEEVLVRSSAELGVSILGSTAPSAFDKLALKRSELFRIQSFIFEITTYDARAPGESSRSREISANMKIDVVETEPR